jgi:F-type H+-transporting ATPase subunit a
MIRCFSLLMFVFGSTAAHAAGGVVNWYDQAYRLVSGEAFDPHGAERFVVIAGGLFTMAVCTVVGIMYKSQVARLGDDVAPDGKFSLRTLVDMAMDMVVGLSKDNLGGQWRAHAPLLAGIFMFILISNLGGLIPGLIPATENISSNLAIGLMVFIIYNIAGFREHGWHYIKQFTGPMLAIAPLMFVIELIGHMVRPVSLSLRLMCNIFADHLLVGIFSTNVPYVLIPSALLFFGVLVALVQSYLFTLLTSVYISMAVSHDH